MALITTKFITDNAVTNAKIRLLNTGWLRSRNAANSADINILSVDASDVIQFGSVPQTPSMPVSNDDVSNKVYVDQVVTNLIDKAKSVSFTLSGTDISNGYIDLADLAFTDSVYVDAGGVGQVVGLDYSLSAVGGVTRITFLSPLSSILASGDDLTVSYNISTSIVSGGPVFVNLLKEVAVINDTKASGTAGGTGTAATWVTRTLNTVQASQPWLSLAGNQFTLEAGTYEIKGSAPASQVSRHQAKLRDITNSVDAIIGSSEYNQFTGGVGAQSSSLIEGVLTISAATTYEVQHNIQGSTGSEDFGIQATFGVSEIYTQLEISKINQTAKDFFIGPVCTTSDTISVNTFTTWPNSPTLIMTPTVSGAYRVYSNPSIHNQNAAVISVTKIFNTSGNATLLAENESTLDVTVANIIAAQPVESIFNLVAGITYSFDIQSKILSGDVFIRGDEATFYIAAEKLGSVIGGALTTPDTFFIGPDCITSSSGVSSTYPSWTTFDNSPTLTFTPAISGAWKVYTPGAYYTPGGTPDYARILNSAGGATLLKESQVMFDGETYSSMLTQSIYNLTAGVSYSFDVQGATGAGANPISFRGDVIPVNIFAEKI